MRQRFRVGVVSLSLALLAACEVGAGSLERTRSADIAGAREAFLRNIQAIHDRDTEAYLASYLDSPDFVVAGGDGLDLGFEDFAADRRADNTWPDTLIAGEPRLVWIAPGVVYGAYPYTVTIEGETTSGWSERVLVRTTRDWKIAVTSVIPSNTEDGE